MYNALPSFKAGEVVEIAGSRNRLVNHHQVPRPY
jgi:hypothetical protein